MNLDMYQKNAAEQSYKFSAIIAGAGTGKTQTLLGRIKFLMNSEGLSAQDILVISYTNESVKDFQRKLKSFGYPVTVLTFHKLAMYIISLISHDISICDSDNLKTIVHEFFASYAFYSHKIKKITFHTLSLKQRFKYFNYQKYLNSNDYLLLEKNLCNFICSMKSKALDHNFLSRLYWQSSKNQKAFIILTNIIYSLYESEKSSQFEYDFDDLIYMAISIICTKDVSFPYKHILVDEFQDSSKIRIDLLTCIVKKYNLGFTIVGDDWQSIYRFSGTEVNCFELIKKNFPSMVATYLQKTYRNSQELINVASKFIEKNPMQMRKKIYSDIHVSKPIELIYYRNNSYAKKAIYTVIRKHPNDSILFLGRNSFDWKYYFNLEEINWIDHKQFKLKSFEEKIFTFLTVHQSKGLEADVVILLHLENSTYGFPNLLKYPSYFPDCFSKDSFPLEEERRLFYVALTRTKSKIYLFSPVSSPSVFAQEIIKNSKNQILVSYF